MGSPAIACIGVIGKQNNPLHIAIFPPHLDSRIELTQLLNSCLDIFDIRRKHTAVDQDLGLLHAFEERLAAYGWITNTEVKFLIIVDVEGRPEQAELSAKDATAKTGLRDSDLKPAFRALQTAYMRLLQNPFYNPSDDDPIAMSTVAPSGSLRITNRQFVQEVSRIGESWAPGMTSV